MATTDETFDPNDLESIDALLDEAELEATPYEPEESEVATQADQSNDGLDGLDAEPEAETDTEDLLDSLDDLVVEPTPEPEVAAVSEAAPVNTPGVEKSALNEVPKSASVEADRDAEDFLSKRVAAQASQNSNITAGDMDSIKKLIIIFGSILSVLALVGIGIGVWSALAASSAGMNEETQTLIESIKVSSEKNGANLSTAEETVKSVEKKLDAINFQLQQMTTDIGALEPAAKQVKEAPLDPLGLNKPVDKTLPNGSETAGVKATTNIMPKAITETKVVAESPALMKKVTSVNSKLIKAQRRIDEVNARVKKIQAQYNLLIHSVKTVEKQVLLEQAEKAEKTKLDEKAKEKNRYQYSAPDGGFYDQSVTDSYP